MVRTTDARTFAFVLGLHLALLWAVMRPASMPAVDERRDWVQLLQVPVSVPAPQPLVVPAKPAVEPKPETRPSAARSIPSAAERPAPAAELAQATGPAEFSAPEKAEPPQTVTSRIPPEVLREAIKAAVATHRQLRTEPGQEFTPAPDSMRARLAKGFAAAHAAVKPGLLEAPRIELISAPRDPKRIYRVTTGMGEYCLFYPDKGGISANSDPRSGRPEFGQPMASSCPIPF